MPTVPAFFFTLVRKIPSLARIPEAEPSDNSFPAADIGQLHRITSDPAAVIDDQTWKDMLLDAYCAQLSPQVSIFGQQVLHQRLRAGLGEEKRAALVARLREMIDDAAGLAALRQACKPLRNADAEVAALLFEGREHSVPAWAGKAWLLAVALAATVAAAALSPLAWLGTGLALYLLMAIQIGYASRVQVWESELKSLGLMLGVCSVLGGLKDPALAHFARLARHAGVINRQLSRSIMARGVPGVAIYADWFLLANVEHYFRTMRIVAAERAFLRDCYTHCSNLEADIALARHLFEIPSNCWASRAGGKEIMFDSAVHPLLPDAAPLSIRLDGRGAFISGQNGIGKSTLLRTVGLNLITARAFGFSYARAAHVPALAVYASMQNDDSLPGAESLYMAEVRRARELLAAAQGPHGGIFIIDEIFRGTNHIESVAAAAAVLDVLASHGVVIVSSHNLVLASLLSHRLTPLRLTARGGDRAKLVLEPGVLRQTNGIALLAAGGFDAGIEANAARVFAWLSEHLAQPGEGAQVLAPRRAALAG